MRNKKYCHTSIILLLCLSLMGGCAYRDSREDTKEAIIESNSELQKLKKEKVQDINSVHLRDRDVLYQNDEETSIVTMYLTVSSGNSSENTDHTWEEINTYSVYDYDKMGVDRYRVNALLQVGDENGPVIGALGYGDTVPNATVQIRGQTSSKYSQKNYKIEIKKNKGTWEGQRTINLNKHQQDGLRFRNKLTYDLLKGIPQLMSLRTQFVHLYVKDTTEGGEGKFEDYGLYTQVEQLNKTGLKVHGLDSNGQLYKINYFEFYRYENIIKTQEDPTFDKKAFEELLEIKGSTDHTKLIEMLEAVNDFTTPIEEVLEKYFDTENLTFWMAFQILIGNIDTQNRNMFLYSPLNSETWYLISWDHDDSFMNCELTFEDYNDRGSWISGISNYWGNVLFQRCLKSDHFREMLENAIQELCSYLSEERLSNMAEQYALVVKPYAFQMPDRMHEPLTEEQYDLVVNALPDEIEQNYQMYLETLEKPMPFYIGVPTIAKGKLNVNWDIAYDFDGEDITYTVEFAKDYAFKQVIYKKENLMIPEASIDVPEPGQYFIRVRATNTSGKVQEAFDYYVSDTGKNYGMKCFYVNADGTIGEDTYDE